MKTLKTWGLLVWVGLLTTGLAGCLFSPDKKDKPPEVIIEYLPRTSIDNVLQNLITSYENENLEEYEKLFDRDLFTFVFDPNDVSEDPDLDPFWNWPEERDATEGMFNSEDVEKIELDFVKLRERPSEEADEPLVPGSRYVFLSEVLLRVTTRTFVEGDPTPIVFEVNGDGAEFYFIQDPEETEDELPVWKIVEWRDKPIGALVATGAGVD